MWWVGALTAGAALVSGWEWFGRVMAGVAFAAFGPLSLHGALPVFSTSEASVDRLMELGVAPGPTVRVLSEAVGASLTGAPISNPATSSQVQMPLSGLMLNALLPQYAVAGS